MRAPGVFQFVTQIGEGVRFPVIVRAECRSHGGFQVRGPESGCGEFIVKRGYFSGQPGGIGQVLAGECLSRRMALVVLWSGQGAPPP